jgi:hypothetical protein
MTIAMSGDLPRFQPFEFPFNGPVKEHARRIQTRFGYGRFDTFSKFIGHINR